MKLTITKRPKYTKAFVDQTGRERIYFNKPGQPKTPLPGYPGSEAFDTAYQACLDAANGVKLAEPPKHEGPIPGSLGDLSARFFASMEFKALKPITQQTYRRVIKRLVEKHGDKPVTELDRKGVRKVMSEAGSPGAANQVLKFIRMLMRFAILEEMRNDDPTFGIKKLKVNKGYIPWDEEHIETFCDFYPPGSKPRLALQLLVCTAQRRTDVVTFGRQHLKNGRLHVRQSKTGVSLKIPIHPDLQAELDALPKDRMTFLLTEYGKPFTPAGFGNWFGAKCRAAGLEKGFNGHGLRKACSRRLAEAGATPHEIMSITGHKTLSEVERYTKAVDQPLMAERGMGLLVALSNRLSKV